MEISQTWFHGHPNAIDCPRIKFRVGFRLFYYIRDSKHDWRDPTRVYIGMTKKESNQSFRK